MNDLSHWDFAQNFCGHDVAALILGIEPDTVAPHAPRVYVVRRRMEQDFALAVQQAQSESDIFFDSEQERITKANRSDNMLVSIQLDKLWRDALAGINKADTELLVNGDLLQFEDQMFDRSEIARWLKAICMPSKYSFDRSQDESQRGERRGAIEPEDLPVELDVALIAFQAVRNGYGDQSATYRNRLEAYLVQHYPSLKQSEIDRIATVANPDKERGRKKFDG